MAIRKESETIKHEKHHLTLETFQKTLQVRECIMQETDRTLFEDSVELIRQQREERTRQIEQALQYCR